MTERCKFVTVQEKQADWVKAKVAIGRCLSCIRTWELWEPGLISAWQYIFNFYFCFKKQTVFQKIFNAFHLCLLSTLNFTKLPNENKQYTGEGEAARCGKQKWGILKRLGAVVSGNMGI